MLKTQEYQPSTLRINITNAEMTCPICGETAYYSWLPTRCGKCDTRFEWKITAFYDEEAVQVKKEE